MTSSSTNWQAHHTWSAPIWVMFGPIIGCLRQLSGMLLFLAYASSSTNNPCSPSDADAENTGSAPRDMSWYIYYCEVSSRKRIRWYAYYWEESLLSGALQFETKSDYRWLCSWLPLVLTVSIGMTYCRRINTFKSSSTHILKSSFISSLHLKCYSSIAQHYPTYWLDHHLKATAYTASHHATGSTLFHRRSISNQYWDRTKNWVSPKRCWWRCGAEALRALVDDQNWLEMLKPHQQVHISRRPQACGRLFVIGIDVCLLALYSRDLPWFSSGINDKICWIQRGYAHWQQILTEKADW